MTPDLTRLGSGCAGMLRAWKKYLSVALGIVSLTAAPANTMAQQDMPQSWLQFAALASRQFETQLAQEESDSVQRLHAGLVQQSASSVGGGASRLVVQVWVAGDSRVTRVRFATLGDAQLDQDLSAILTEKPLSAPPPPDMPQPIVLQLSLGLQI